jgi:hypothetical protein
VRDPWQFTSARDGDADDGFFQTLVLGTGAARRG